MPRNSSLQQGPLHAGIYIINACSLGRAAYHLLHQAEVHTSVALKVIPAGSICGVTPPSPTLQPRALRCFMSHGMSSASCRCSSLKLTVVETLRRVVTSRRQDSSILQLGRSGSV